LGKAEHPCPEQSPSLLTAPQDATQNTTAEIGEHKQAAHFGIMNDKPAFFLYLSNHAFFQSFSWFKLPSQTVPLAFLNIAGFLVAILQI
jgi:hypothetical protein